MSLQFVQTQILHNHCCIEKFQRQVKFKRYYLSSNQKQASAQTLGSAFLDRIRKGQNSKYETDLFKKLDCFIDDHGSGQRDYVSFVMS